MSLDNMLKKLSVRSPWLFRINAGSCNGCDVELATTACIPRYDVERLGCRYCGSPRHADIVLVTGPLTTRVRDRVLKVWNEIPEPKVTVAVGICPISGGVFREGYSIEGPLDRYIPVDVNVPGCPPRPEMLIHSILELRKQVKENHKLTKKARVAAAQAAEAAALSATPIHELKGLLA